MRISTRRTDWRSRLELQQLEPRCLMCADSVLIRADVFDVQQNAFEVSLPVLANDASSAMADQVVKLGYDSSQYQRHDIRISDDAKSIVYTPQPYFTGEVKLTYGVSSDSFCRADVVVNVVSPIQNDAYVLPPDRDTYVLDVLENDSFAAEFGVARSIDDVVGSYGMDGVVEVSEDRQHLILHRAAGFYGQQTLFYVVDGIRFGAQVIVEFPNPIEPDYLSVPFGQETAASVDVIGNDPFWDGYSGQRKITELLQTPSGAEVQIASDGKTIQLTPNGMGIGNHEIKYRIDDTIEGTLSVGVAQVARDDHYTIVPNSAENEFSVLRNDGDRYLNPSVTTHAITSLSQTAAGGEVSIRFGSRVLYTPPENFIGTDYFTYVADGIHEAAVRVEVNKYESSLRSDTFDVLEGTAENILDVLSNDFRGVAYAGEKKITSVTEPNTANVRIADDGQTLMFTPLTSDHSHRFTYTVDHVFTEHVRVDLERAAGWGNLNLDGSEEYLVPLVDEFVDFPPGYEGQRQITAVSEPLPWKSLLGPWDSAKNETEKEEFGSITVGADGRSVTYVPAEVMESVGVRYSVDDKFEGVFYFSAPVNLVRDEETTYQGQPVEVNVVENDFNPDGEAPMHRITHLSRISGGGEVRIADDGHTLVYDPGSLFAGKAVFEYRVNGMGRTDVTFDVLPLLRGDHFYLPPVAAEDEHQPVVLKVLENDRIGVDVGKPTRIVSVGEATFGDVSIDSLGRHILYQPRERASGSDSFTYAVEGGLEAAVTVDWGQQAQHAKQQDRFLSDAVFAIDGTVPGKSDYTESKSWPSPHSDRVTQLVHEQTGDFYQFVGSSVVILDQASQNVQSQTNFKGNAVSMHLHADQLVVVSNGRHRDPIIQFNERYRLLSGESDRMTYVTVFDVSNPAAPQVVQRTEMEGQYIDSWMDSGRLRLLIVDDALYHKTLHWDSAGDLESEIAWADRVEHEIGRTIQDAMPKFSSYGPNGEFIRAGLMLSSTDVFEHVGDESREIIAVVTIDVENTEPGIRSATGILVDGTSRVFRGDDHFYVLEQVNAGSGFTESDYYRDTVISMFEFAGDDVKRLSAGTVPGVWADYRANPTLHEYGGRLHLVTHLVPPNATEPHRPFTGGGVVISVGASGEADDNDIPYENQFLVVENDNGVMRVVSSIRQIGQGGTSPLGLHYGAGVALVAESGQELKYQLLDFRNPVALTQNRIQLPNASQRWSTSNSYPSAAVFWGGEDRIVVRGLTNTSLPFAVSNLRVFNVADFRNPFVVLEEDFLDAGISDELTSRLAEVGVSIDGPSEEFLRSAATVNLLTWQGELSDDQPILSEDLESLAQTHVLQSVAIQHVANDQGIDSADVTLLATEATSGYTTITLKGNDRLFAYRSTDGVTVSQFDWQPPKPGDVEWTNAANRYDVDGSGAVAPRDVLATVRVINNGRRGRLPTANVVQQIKSDAGLMVDVNGDGHLSALDVLHIVRHLNARSGQQQGSAEPHLDVQNAAAASVSTQEELVDSIFAEHDERVAANA